jgi:phosphate:Na+ symporter
MLTDIHPAILDGSGVEILAVERQDDEVDALHGQIVAYLGKISKTPLSETSTEELVGLLSATNDLEAIGDIIETNMAQLGLTRVEHDLVISSHTRRVLAGFHDTVLEGFDLAVEALTDKHAESARRVVEMKRTVNRLEADAHAHEAERLVAPEPRRVDTYRFEVDVISNLKRVFYFSRRIARAAIPPEERTGV